MEKVKSPLYYKSKRNISTFFLRAFVLGGGKGIEKLLHTASSDRNSASAICKSTRHNGGRSRTVRRAKTSGNACLFLPQAQQVITVLDWRREKLMEHSCERATGKARKIYTIFVPLSRSLLAENEQFMSKSSICFRFYKFQDAVELSRKDISGSLPLRKMHRVGWGEVCEIMFQFSSRRMKSCCILWNAKKCRNQDFRLCTLTLTL